MFNKLGNILTILENHEISRNMFLMKLKDIYHYFMLFKLSATSYEHLKPILMDNKNGAQSTNQKTGKDAAASPERTCW